MVFYLWQKENHFNDLCVPLFLYVNLISTMYIHVQSNPKHHHFLMSLSEVCLLFLSHGKSELTWKKLMMHFLSTGSLHFSNTKCGGRSNIGDIKGLYHQVSSCVMLNRARSFLFSTMRRCICLTWWCACMMYATRVCHVSSVPWSLKHDRHSETHKDFIWNHKKWRKTRKVTRSNRDRILRVGSQNDGNDDGVSDG